MTPVNLNPPPSPFQLAQQKDEQHLHLSYLQYSSYLPPPPSSLSYPTFLNSSSIQDQPMIKLEDSQLLDQKVDQYFIAHGGSSDDIQTFPSSNSIHPTVNNNKQKTTREVGEGSTSDNGSSAKWMSSKMRLMQKMKNSNSTRTDESAKNTRKLQYQLHEHDNNEVNSFNISNNTIRVCADCNTTTTPLWRSGPRGPKSLCNACGIRQRKARRAMEAAGNGTIASTDTSCMKIKLHSKENIKWRTNHVPQYKKQCKSTDHPPPYHHQSQRNLCFKGLALSLSKNSALKQVFTQDVEEAAILLMELSCALIQS